MNASSIKKNINIRLCKLYNDRKQGFYAKPTSLITYEYANISIFNFTSALLFFRKKLNLPVLFTKNNSQMQKAKNNSHHTLIAEA